MRISLCACAAFAAIADACAYAITPGYKAAFAKKTPSGPIANADKFVGSAALGVLSNIFNAAHKELLKDAANDLPNSGPDSEIALQINPLWDAALVSQRINPEDKFYVEKDGKHKQGPLNSKQGFFMGRHGQERRPASTFPLLCKSRSHHWV